MRSIDSEYYVNIYSYFQYYPSTCECVCAVLFFYTFTKCVKSEINEVMSCSPRFNPNIKPNRKPRTNSYRVTSIQCINKHVTHGSSFNSFWMVWLPYCFCCWCHRRFMMRNIAHDIILDIASHGFSYWNRFCASTQINVKFLIIFVGIEPAMNEYFLVCTSAQKHVTFSHR